MSVCGTVSTGNTAALFSVSGLRDPLWPKPPRQSFRTTGTINRPPLSHVHARNSLNRAGAGILNLPSIAYAYWPRLRIRLTPGGRTFPGKPWVYGGRGSHPAYRYSCLHSHFQKLHHGFRHSFTVVGTLPYQAPTTNRLCFQSFGILLIANHFRRGNTR